MFFPLLFPPSALSWDSSPAKTNEIQALMSHCKNSLKDKAIRGRFVRIQREATLQGVNCCRGQGLKAMELGLARFCEWHPTPVLLLRKSHGRRSLVGCSPWGYEESDTTEQLHFHFSLSCIGEGNGNPLQCSCLENPRDGEAWWAAVYGVSQSRTRLKRLSSSSSSSNGTPLQYSRLENPMDGGAW